MSERQPPGGVAAAQFSSLWPTDITNNHRGCHDDDDDGDGDGGEGGHG